MDQVRQVLRYHHYAYRTEQAYCDWILRYIEFHSGKTHPCQIVETQIFKTTEIYTHVMQKEISAVLSPLDRLS